MFFNLSNISQGHNKEVQHIASCGIPIFLIGMMGSGKTTIGKILTDLFQWECVDMDSQIQRHEGISINEIFATHGEQYFRYKEKELLANLVSKKHTVISCGGGVFMYKDNIDIINKHGISVFLNTHPSIIMQRLANDKNRPLLKGSKSPLQILEEREPFYKQAKVIVNIEKSDIKTNVINCIESIYRYLQII